MATDSSSDRSLSPDNSFSHEDSDQPLTLRFIASMKEAGGIIGKGGENVKRFREESGARINISDASSSERIVVIMGTRPQIKKAFRLIGDKFEEDLQNSGQDDSHVVFRLVVPNTNCGSLIGKSGANIKELRETSGATIQVANEMLPSSTERCVNLSGAMDSMSKALERILTIAVETKPKGPSIPYQPGGGYGGGQSRGYGGGAGYDGGSGGYGGGQGYGGYGSRDNRMNGARGGGRGFGMMGGDGPYGGGGGGMRNAYAADYSDSGMLGNAGGFQGGAGGFPSGGGAGGRTVTKEIVVAGEIVGSIIGRQGSKINEIRQSSQAQVKVADADDGSTDRRVVVSGSAQSVSTAVRLINNIITRYKASKE